MSIPRLALALFLAAALAACRSDTGNEGAALDGASAATADAASSPMDGSAPGPDMAMERLPWDRDLSLVVRGLVATEGKTAWLRIHYTVTDIKTTWRQATIRDGVVMLAWAGGFDSNTFGEFVELFVDRDGDGKCTEGADPAWQIFINNSFTMGVVKADVDVFDPADLATPRACAELMM